MRIQTVIRKSWEDFSNPKFLLLFLVPFVVLTILFTAGVSSGAPENLSSMPLRIQERELTEAFSQLSFIWFAGIPVMAFAAVISANAIAKEEEEGSLRILLSKPVRRWEVILGKFFAILLFSFLVMLAGMFLGSIFVYHLTGASSTALSGSILSIMPGNVFYALFVSFFVGSLGVGFSVLTASRMKTAITVIILTVILLFSFILVRMGTQAMGLYGSYGIYVLDLNHHLGNSFVFIHDSLGSQFTPMTQSALSSFTGAFDTSGAQVDPLIGGMPTSLPVGEYLAPAVSFFGVFGISIAILVASVYRFERKDIM